MGGMTVCLHQFYLSTEIYRQIECVHTGDGCRWATSKCTQTLRNMESRIAVLPPQANLAINQIDPIHTVPWGTEDTGIAGTPASLWASTAD